MALLHCTSIPSSSRQSSILNESIAPTALTCPPTPDSCRTARLIPLTSKPSTETTIPISLPHHRVPLTLALSKRFRPRVLIRRIRTSHRRRSNNSKRTITHPVDHIPRINLILHRHLVTIRPLLRRTLHSINNINNNILQPPLVAPILLQACPVPSVLPVDEKRC